jgi:hypothetical protein
MEKKIIIIENVALLVIDDKALMLQKTKDRDTDHIWWSGVCDCCGWWERFDAIEKEHGLKCYTGEDYKVRDIFGKTSFNLDELIPIATEDQIRKLAAIEAYPI